MINLKYLFLYQTVQNGRRHIGALQQFFLGDFFRAVTLDGNAHNIIGDAELASQLAKAQTEIESQRGTIALLKEQVDSLNAQINRLDSNLKDKDAIIELLKERR